MLRVGVIGYGYWGPKVVRNLHAVTDCQLVAVCDKNPKATEHLGVSYPGVRTTTDARDIAMASDIDAVAIITPVSTHYALTRQCLEQGKHVFVEKPFTTSVPQAEDLLELAESKQLTITVDHTFLFTEAVKKIKDLIDQEVLGKLYYYDSTRVNLGLFQHDVNVIGDLASHDLSILDYVIADRPVALTATGVAHINGQEDMAYITLHYPQNFIAHINVNWLSPVKVRTMVIGGEQRMLVWDDIEIDDKMKLYDKGVSVTRGTSVCGLEINYRSGNMSVLKIEPHEALQSVAESFVTCILHNKKPLNDGLAGWRVVKLLEAANRSLRKRGEIVEL